MREDGRWRLESRAVDGPGHFDALPVPPRSADARVRALLDRAMVIDAVTALSYAIDHEDEGLLRACVTPDVTVGEAEIGVVSGVDALVDVLRATMWAMDGTWLFMNNHLVHIAGDDATVQSYVFIIERPAGAAEPHVVDRRRPPVRRPVAARRGRLARGRAPGGDQHDAGRQGHAAPGG